MLTERVVGTYPDSCHGLPPGAGEDGGAAREWRWSCAGRYVLGQEDGVTDLDVQYDASLTGRQRARYAAMLQDAEDDQWMTQQAAAR